MFVLHHLHGGKVIAIHCCQSRMLWCYVMVDVCVGSRDVWFECEVV